MRAVIAYDIADDSKRVRVSNALLDCGKRVQYSVFECFLNPLRIAKLQEQLHQLIDSDTDSVRVYRLCEICGGRAGILGEGQKTKETRYLIV